jgi:CO/xanthine dehydrogenase Mo-binding subunit
VPFESVRVHENDSGRAVYGTGTYASRTAVVAGGAIRRRRADAHGGQSAKAAEPRPRHHVHGRPG